MIAVTLRDDSYESLRQLRPIIFLTVRNNKDQARIHRELGKMGYIPHLTNSTRDRDEWRFHHPDGIQP